MPVSQPVRRAFRAGASGGSICAKEKASLEQAIDGMNTVGYTATGRYGYGAAKKTGNVYFTCVTSTRHNESKTKASKENPMVGQARHFLVSGCGAGSAAPGRPAERVPKTSSRLHHYRGCRRRHGESVMPDFTNVARKDSGLRFAGNISPALRFRILKGTGGKMVSPLHPVVGLEIFGNNRWFRSLWPRTGGSLGRWSRGCQADGADKTGSMVQWRLACGMVLSRSQWAVVGFTLRDDHV